MNDAAVPEALSISSCLAPLFLLFLREEDSQGYELTRGIEDFDLGEVGLETMYRALALIEREGMVVSERDGSDLTLSQRRYSITGPGESYLESWADSLARYQVMVDLFLTVYEGYTRETTTRAPAVGGRDGT
jgi:PadR family transcriptional regulator PadR